MYPPPGTPTVQLVLITLSGTVLAARGETRAGLNAGIWVVSSCRGEEHPSKLEHRSMRGIVDEPRYELAAQSPAPVGFESRGSICVATHTQR